mmetsp:Transcript_127576/g.254907  ORF Transcript_127576/g.254907 Transcript_127576/m.254907 type:complete len:371 (-) Transcript_127576:238-1350(-)|eukprot:CAMPEP_0172659024 /NCGR_PEP_ID=MMETSP1074-20121228/3144_1 /TAXON_ID=2916 /ORGANISM="Ceratium fusus, Strain PA161109" /LENGTH=370 /DNA_ID=CAMNT_0013474411 /DNA_START=73 /DNA_END=1185 /DNA_ORIENTATION=+
MASRTVVRWKPKATIVALLCVGFVTKHGVLEFVGLVRPVYQAIDSPTALHAEPADDIFRTVAVAGATGRTGRLVVAELLRSGYADEVLAIVRNVTKAAEVLDADDSRIRVVACNLEDKAAAQEVWADAEAVVWCLEGQTGLGTLATAFPAQQHDDGQPRMVMCSSAAITRPTWSRTKKERFPGCADIPIVRLNPNDILGNKRQAEDVLRSAGMPYTVVRPTGLNDNWPPGRPLLSQGDFAVGRISRADLASVLVALLKEPAAIGKTFEVTSVAGYPKPRNGYGQVLAGFKSDTSSTTSSFWRRLAQRFWPASQVEGADAATYSVLQQLLPGEEQESAGLAMGQTYEQYDKKEEGRLGPRGSERVPSTITG